MTKCQMFANAMEDCRLKLQGLQRHQSRFVAGFFWRRTQRELITGWCEQLSICAAADYDEAVEMFTRGRDDEVATLFENPLQTTITTDRATSLAEAIQSANQALARWLEFAVEVQDRCSGMIEGFRKNATAGLLPG
jgi:hypothetical protein